MVNLSEIQISKTTTKQSILDKHTITSLISEYTLIGYFFILSFFPFSADILKLLCILTMIGCWIAQVIIEKKTLCIKTPINSPIFLFLFCLLLSSFFSNNIIRNLESIMHDEIRYFIVFFCMINTIRSLDQIKRIVTTMLVTCGLVCLYGLYGYNTGIAIRDGRLIATFGYHTLISEYISLLLPIAVCLLFHYKGILARLSLGLIVAICSFSLILTMTRTSWIAVIITVIFISLAMHKKYVIYILIGACALLVFFLPSKYVHHAKTITQVDKFFTTEIILGKRLSGWKESFSIIRDNPVFGIGPNSRVFRKTYLLYAEKTKTQKNLEIVKEPEQAEKTKTKKKHSRKITSLSHSHNIFLQMGVEVGIIGFLAFTWLCAVVFCSSIKLWSTVKTEYEKALLLGITASLVSIFLHGLTENFWKKPTILFLWFIVGILFVIQNVLRNTIKQ